MLESVMATMKIILIIIIMIIIIIRVMFDKRILNINNYVHKLYMDNKHKKNTI